MKKTITTLTIVSILALGVGSAFAWGGGYGSCPGFGNGNGYGHRGGGMGYGSHMNQPATPEFQQFLDETTDLRAQLAADHVKLRAQMHSATPDNARIEQLTASITKAQTELRQKANEAGIQANNGRRGFGHRG